MKPGKLTAFPQSVNLEPGETVIFSWIVCESRAHRDEVNDKVMQLTGSGHTKFGRHALVRLGNVAQIDKFFTDAPIPPAALEAFEKAGVEVLVAAGTCFLP